MARTSGKRRTRARYARITSPSKSQSPKKRTAPRTSRLKKDNEDDPPTEAKWATMASYRSFVGEYLKTSRVVS